MAAAEGKSQAIENRYHYEKEAEPRDQREVGEGSAEDRPEQVCAKGSGGRTHMPEALSEDEVGDEDRGEGERCRRQEAQHDRKTQQRILRDDESDAQGYEQRNVQQHRAWELYVPRGLDRRVDTQQDAGEHERVHEPSRSEQERELDEILCLEQQECCSHPEQVQEWSHLVERPRRHPHHEEGRRQDQAEDQEIEVRDRRNRQVRVRTVVRDRRHRLSFPERRAARSFALERDSVYL